MPTAAELRVKQLAERQAVFDKLPRIKLADTNDVVDMTGMETSPARKYEKVHADAVEGKLPIQRGWKHAGAVFTPGTNKGGENGWKPDSVYGTIADIVTRAGRSGITAQELVTQVRLRQIGNKRSFYCTGLPPVGWAEGWVNTAVTKNIAGIHATKRAPALVTAPKGEEATPAQNKAAEAIAAQPGGAAAEQSKPDTKGEGEGKPTEAKAA